MSISPARYPAVVVHADWSLHPQKRWVARAHKDATGSYTIGAPEPVGEVGTLLQRLRRELPQQASLLAGFDFPIGLPLTYARQAGITDFLKWLPQAGRGRWSRFYDVAARPEAISLERPFYPVRPGGTRQTHLLEALHVQAMDDLRRRCDMPRGDRRAAAALFWTMGAQQVGKAAISGWRDVLAPALRERTLRAAVWPFAGTLAELLARPAGTTVLAEAYPGGYYQQLGLSWKGPDGRRNSKRLQSARKANAAALLDWATEASVTVEPELQRAIAIGFGPGPGGEDPFDAVVGLLGMLNALLGQDSSAYEPQDEQVRRIEGWIVGLPWAED